MAALAASAQRRSGSRGVARGPCSCAAELSQTVGTLHLGSAPNGQEPSRVGEIQRARLLSASGQVVSEYGAGAVTVAQVVERAGISRRTFYDLFADVQDCLLAVLDDALQLARQRVVAAWRSNGGWRERARLCLVELLCLFEEDPVAARLLIVESLAGDRRVLEFRSRVLDDLIEAIDESARSEAKADGDTSLAAESAIGGVLGVLHARLSRRGSGTLVELVGPLMSILVLPYYGAAAAKRELSQPVPAPRGGRESENPMPPLQADPFKDAGMRLTYRTARVLSVIAGRPDSSNRQIGNFAGINDQGQVSRLLARLERIGMIANKGGGQVRGEPNAWSLTPAGDRLSRNLRIHAESDQSMHDEERTAVSSEQVSSMNREREE